MSKRSELVNLGDPLPLTYAPVRRRSIHHQYQHQQKQQPLQNTLHPNPIPNPNPNPMHNNIIPQASTTNDLRLFITTNNKPCSRMSYTTKERVKNKLRQLIHEVNELEQIEETRLLEIEEKLNDLSDLLTQDLNGTTTNQLEKIEQEITTEEEMLTELEHAKANLQNLKLLNKQKYNFINNWKYWILFGILLSIGFFLLSSLIIADFKYQYCYYFC